MSAFTHRSQSTEAGRLVQGQGGVKAWIRARSPGTTHMHPSSEDRSEGGSLGQSSVNWGSPSRAALSKDWTSGVPWSGSWYVCLVSHQNHEFGGIPRVGMCRAKPWGRGRGHPIRDSENDSPGAVGT